MSKMFQDIKDFHEKFGLAYEGKPRMLSPELGSFRLKFLLEELEEYAKAAASIRKVRPGETLLPGFDIAQQLEQMFDALIDEVYVAMGTAYLHGFDWDKGWDRVHTANMQKVRAERPEDSKRGTTYDVVKPPGWVAPSHYDLVADHAHQ